MYSLEIEVNIQATDSNKIDGHHWSKKHNLRKLIKNEIHYKTLKNKPVKPLENFTLTVTRYCPAKNFLDYDNMITSFKPIPDGLKRAGIIRNDSWKFISRINYFQDQIKSEEMKIKIKVEGY